MRAVREARRKACSIHVDDERQSNAKHIVGVPSGCGGRTPSAVSLLLDLFLNKPSSSLLAYGLRALATPLTRPTEIGSTYGDVSPAFLALRGDPRGDGPYEVFRFLPESLGYSYESALIEDKGPLWSFMKTHIDAGTPILTEQWDGGVFCGYRERDGKREVLFIWNEPRWLDIAELQPYEVCALVKTRRTPDASAVWRESLKRALRFALPHDFKRGNETIPQGLSALHAYLADVKDPAKDFQNCQEWFCWATFSRLAARKACATWLRRVARTSDKRLADKLTAAAQQYDKAYKLYDRYRVEVGAGTSSTEDLASRARTPKRIAVIAPILEVGIAEEARAVDLLKDAVAMAAR